MGEVLNFPMAKRLIRFRPAAVKREDDEQRAGRPVENGRLVRPGKRPSWGVFDTPGEDSPDAA